ncbi:hypothetical protein DEO72_LG1g1045 [Vigna unguiculata]|uniref:Uncharacterized protein n=1 Tax=Vigna unguiculata TaxID=3917 RepID=A0A4D6KS16_VIGUN|nr:hypothetical protein DEO72_LG1g1045 [Vigna unguiculata]
MPAASRTSNGLSDGSSGTVGGAVAGLGDADSKPCARVSQSRWPVRWRQVLVGYGGAMKEPRAQEKKREGGNSGSWVLDGGVSRRPWDLRQRQLRLESWWLEALEMGLPLVK